MQVIFSCEDKTYMWWQAELLHYSLGRCGSNAELTALISPDGGEKNSFSCKTQYVRSYKNDCDGAPLMVLNKPGAIAEWAAMDDRSNETVLIVDPDTIFHCNICAPTSFGAGEAYSEEHDYMAVDIPPNKLVLDRHCGASYRAKVQPVGIYILISRSCLVELAKRWLQRAVEIASDRVCREALAGTGWLSDMWGYAIAAAELGIHHQVCALSQVTGSNSLTRPMTHYCYPLMADPHQRWYPETQHPLLWSKWHYQPWTSPPDPELSSNEGRSVLQQLSELVRVKAHQPSLAVSESAI